MGVKGLTITGKLKSQLGKSDASSDFECKLYNIYYIEQVTGLLSESKMILFTIWSHFFNILPKVWNYLNRFALIKKKNGREHEKWKKNQKKNCRKHKKWKRENLAFYQVICNVYIHLIRLKSHTKLQAIKTYRSMKRI